MQRRDFLIHGGLATVGALLTLPLAMTDLRAAGLTSANAAQLTAGDRALLARIGSYGADVYFWGAKVFARATGLKAAKGATNLLVRVNNLEQLTAFLGSKHLRKLGKVQADGNTLSFNFRGAAYTVTNQLPGEFNASVARGGVARGREGVPLFIHQTVLYHPATDTLSDPHLALGAHHIDLAEKPAGGLKAQFQTVLAGWLESKQMGLPLGKGFEEFASSLLASEPTPKAAKHIARAWLQNIAALSAAYDIASLRPLLLSPLVSGSLNSALGLDVEAAVDQVQARRDEQSASEVPDAALWLSVLLAPQIKDATAAEWISGGEDPAAAAAAQTALALATALNSASAAPAQAR